MVEPKDIFWENSHADSLFIIKDITGLILCSNSSIYYIDK